MDFNIIKTAGLNQAQFASLVGVSRVTVNTWIRGHFAPRAAIRHRVRTVLAAIAAAVERGLLPVPRTNRNEEIKRRLSEIEATVNQGA